jgi:hypothetical protein
MSLKHQRLTCAVGLLGAILSLSACDVGGDGTLEGCASMWTGDLEGERSGKLTASLSFAGDLSGWVIFDDEDRWWQFEAIVEDDGSIISRSALAFEGTVDLDACVASGDWTFFDDQTGTYDVAMRRNW